MALKASEPSAVLPFPVPESPVHRMARPRSPSKRKDLRKNIHLGIGAFPGSPAILLRFHHRCTATGVTVPTFLSFGPLSKAPERPEQKVSVTKNFVTKILMFPRGKYRRKLSFFE